MPKAKSEIDKDYLYGLLMPSPCQAQSSPDPVEEDTLEGDPLHDLRTRLSSESLAAIPAEPNGLILTNVIELLVSERLEQAFEKFNCCRCDKCKKRAAAFALNELPPNYMAAPSTQIEEILKAYPTKDVTSAIVKAILKIKANPEH